MNKFWSKKVQSTEVLYYSRFCRFNDYNYQTWFDLLGVKDGMKILEVGCGGGHFLNMIKKYFPSCDVYGIDLDEGHIEFAKSKSKELNLEVNYSVEDIKNLPFSDNEFDLVLSHTVIEHLPFEDFISEQKRVLKQNGRLVAMLIEVKNKHISEFEYLKDEINGLCDKLDLPEQDKKIGSFALTPAETLKKLDEFGFKNSKVEFKEILFYCPDVCDNYLEGLKQIEHMEDSGKYNIAFVLQLAKNAQEYQDKIVELINQKYEKRKQMYSSKEKIYDYESTPLIVYSANK